VRIKGHDEPVSARRLLAVVPGHEVAAGTESTLVGRRWEMAVLEAMVEQVIGGRGGVVGVAGPPGIGKSRAAREAAALATDRRIEVVWAYCESHASDIPFHAVRRLLRAVGGIEDLDGEAARARVRERVPEADVQELAAVVARRQQLTEMLVMEQNRLEHASKVLHRALRAHIDYLRKQVKRADDDLNRAVRDSTLWGQI